MLRACVVVAGVAMLLACLVLDGDKLRVDGVEVAVELADLPTSIPTRELALEMAKELAMAPPGWHLQIVEGPSEGTMIELPEGRALSIGRAPGMDLVIDDETISREHATVTRYGADVWIEDREATRGTFLGKDRLAPRRATRWSPELAVRLGSCVLALRAPFDWQPRDPAPSPEPLRQPDRIAAPVVEVQVAQNPPRESRNVRAAVIVVALVLVVIGCVVMLVWIL
jgi:hypothetical protein